VIWSEAQQHLSTILPFNDDRRLTLLSMPIGKQVGTDGTSGAGTWMMFVFALLAAVAPFQVHVDGLEFPNGVYHVSC
jgi:hypothetical protein